MNKVKKVLTGIGITFAGLISRVYASQAIAMYGIDPGPRTSPAKSVWDSISKIGKIAIPVILFIIGVFVVLSKKLTKKVKAIVVSILVILAILGYVFMNYIATNF